MPDHGEVAEAKVFFFTWRVGCEVPLDAARSATDLTL
jgi:hypothetical protein